MNTSTINLTISHEGDLPKGLLAAIEAKAYDWTMARGVACGEVVAELSFCQTCKGHGMIGGPSFYAPDEGGVSCPDCMQPSAVAFLRLPVKEMRDE